MSNIPVKKFELKAIRGVGAWSWNSYSDNCGICKCSLSDKCLDCCSGNCDAICNIVWGVCNHSYHLHCMINWQKQRNACPLCNEAWIVQKIEGHV